MLTNAKDWIQEVKIDMSGCYRYEDMGYFLAGLFNTSTVRKNLRKLVLVGGKFKEFAANEIRTSRSITHIEMEDTEMEGHILSRLSPQFTYLERLKLVSCFSNF